MARNVEAAGRVVKPVVEEDSVESWGILAPMSDQDPRATERRVCASCKQPAVTCTLVTVHRLNGIIPLGRTYEHVCQSCKAGFETLSAFRVIYNLGIGALGLALGVLGSFFIVAWVLDYLAGQTGLPSLYQLGGALVVFAFLALGVYEPIAVVRSVRALSRNPVAR